MNAGKLGESAMDRFARALTLATLLAATAASAQVPSSNQRMRFTGDGAVFGVVATATANVSADESFLHVALDQSTIRATPIAKEPRRITGYRIDLAYTKSSGEWDILRKSERVPLDVELGHLDTIPVAARTLTIPIDGVASLNGMWLIFEIDVDGTPPGFTYSHGEKLRVGR
jgi:hypothetical protein